MCFVYISLRHCQTLELMSFTVASYTYIAIAWKHYHIIVSIVLLFNCDSCSYIRVEELPVTT